jgi:hypothetical protein
MAVVVDIADTIVDMLEDMVVNIAFAAGKAIEIALDIAYVGMALVAI